MKAFNSFQIVTLFAVLPYIIEWLHRRPFDYSGAVFWLSIVVYAILYIVSIAAMISLVEDI